MAFMTLTEDDMNLSHSGENTKFEASFLDEENQYKQQDSQTGVRHIFLWLSQHAPPVGYSQGMLSLKKTLWSSSYEEVTSESLYSGDRKKQQNMHNERRAEWNLFPVRPGTWNRQIKSRGVTSLKKLGSIYEVKKLWIYWELGRIVWASLHPLLSEFSSQTVTMPVLSKIF